MWDDDEKYPRFNRLRDGILAFAMDYAMAVIVIGAFALFAWYLR